MARRLAELGAQLVDYLVQFNQTQLVANHGQPFQLLIAGLETAPE
jgi:hypothetical protein